MKAANFVIDGTLTDSVHVHAKAWQMSFQLFGFNFTFPSIRFQVGKGGDQVLPIFQSHNLIEVTGKTIEVTGRSYFAERSSRKLRLFQKCQSFSAACSPMDGPEILLFWILKVLSRN